MKTCAEGLALAHVDPGAEDPAVRDADELVPRLGVHAAGDAAPGVVGDAVLDRPEVGQPERGHLGALPVLLEPAAAVLVERQADDEQPGSGLSTESSDGPSRGCEVRGVAWASTHRGSDG